MIQFDLIPRHTPFKLILKAILALLAALFLLSYLLAAASLIAEGDSVSEADLISWCEDDYAERDFASLHDTLTLYHLYSEPFDLYWEAVEGYEASLDIQSYSACDPALYPKAFTLAQSARERLAQSAASPQFERNRNLLENLLASVS